MNRILIALLIITSCAVPPQRSLPDFPSYRTYKQSDWKKLSQKDKIAQMIMVRVRGDYYHSKHWYRDLLKKWLEKDGIGGVITFGGSIHGSYYNIRHFQNWAKYPLLVAADYERGLGQWMNGATLFPSNMALTATQDTSLAYEQGKITAQEARALGVQIAFAPVMDINNNPENPIINFRSYSDDPETVSKFGSAFIKGAQDHGISACAKHFPGHGNTAIDSHTSIPTIEGSRSKLDSMELYPFRTSLNAGVEMIMVGHIALPGLDESGKPASHSNVITTDILRNEWGFDGIIITDGMEMGSLTESAWAGESAVRSVEAGADILLLPIDVDHAINSILAAVKSGRISEQRINQSVKRIWDMKWKAGLLDGPFQQTFMELEEIIGAPDHKRKPKEIAERSITVVKDVNNQLPLKPERIDSLAHIILSLDDGAREYLKIFSRDISQTHGHVKEVFINDPLTELGRMDILNQMKGVNQAVISLLVRIRMDKGTSTIDSTHSLLLKEMTKLGIPIVVFSFGSPYLPSYETLETYVCTFGYGSITIQAAADALWGRNPINGILPVNLNPEFPRGFGIQKKKRSNSWGYEKNIDFPDAWVVLDSAMNNQIFPGAQVFISKGGNIYFSGGFGRHTYDASSPPVDSETIYDVASLTKVLTTTPIIQKLISQKILALNQPVQQFYPQYAGKWKEKVTLRHLLTHSSGLPGYHEFFLDEHIKNKKNVLDYILTVDLITEPGHQYKYSDLGFILLTSIIEKLSRRSLDKLAASWLFRPLDMKDTYYIPPSDILYRIAPTELDSIYRNRLVHGEVHDENTHLMGGISGHAGVFSTAADIGNYAQMYINGGLWKGQRIFKETQIQEFTTIQHIPKDSDYALGWDTPSQSGASIAGDYFSPGSFGHLGFTGTSIWIDPNNEVIVILLANRVHPSRKGSEGSKEMYGIRRLFYNHVMEQLLAER